MADISEGSIEEQIHSDPGIFLKLSHPTEDMARIAVRRLKEVHEQCPGTIRRHRVCEFIIAIEKHCPASDLFMTLMEIDSTPWKMVPKAYLNIEIGAVVLRDQPIGVDSLLEAIEGINRNDLILRALQKTDPDDFFIYQCILQEVAECAPISSELAFWILDNITRTIYPTELVRFFERFYKREYAIKKLKEPMPK